MTYDMWIGLLIIGLTASTAYYWFTSRLYNHRESAYKDQLEEALKRMDELREKADEQG